MGQGHRGFHSGGPRNPEARAEFLSACLNAGPGGFGKEQSGGPGSPKQVVSGPREENLEQAGQRGHWSRFLHLSVPGLMWQCLAMVVRVECVYCGDLCRTVV